jgi:hypothetical protein
MVSQDFSFRRLAVVKAEDSHKKFAKNCYDSWFVKI